MTLTNEVQTAGGIPSNEVRWIETDGEAIPIDDGNRFSIHAINGMKLDGGMEARVYRVPRDFVARISPAIDAPDGGTTVFALPDFVVPEALKELVPPLLVDISTPLKANGMKFKDPEAAAGYDPGESEILMINDPLNHDLMESMTASLVTPSPRVIEVACDWESGGCSLVTRSGEKASIKRKQGEEVIRLFDVAPNFMATGEVELSLSLNFGDGAALDTRVTVFDGKTVRVGRLPIDGEDRDVSVTVRVKEAHW